MRHIRDDQQLRPVVMVGDGVNDAPALAIADVGIERGAASATVAAETPDAVITGRRSLHIARERLQVGMGLSLAAMIVAAFEYLPPSQAHSSKRESTSQSILNELCARRG